MKPDKREKLNKPEKRNKPDRPFSGSGPDPCGSKRRGYWVMGMDAGYAPPARLSETAARRVLQKGRATRGPGWILTKQM